jgi:hypothetical protein
MTRGNEPLPADLRERPLAIQVNGRVIVNESPATSFTPYAPGRARARPSRSVVGDARVPQVSGNTLAGQRCLGRLELTVIRAEPQRSRQRVFLQLEAPRHRDRRLFKIQRLNTPRSSATGWTRAAVLRSSAETRVARRAVGAARFTITDRATCRDVFGRPRDTDRTLTISVKRLAPAMSAD